MLIFPDSMTFKFSPSKAFKQKSGPVLMYDFEYTETFKNLPPKTYQQTFELAGFNFSNIGCKVTKIPKGFRVKGRADRQTIASMIVGELFSQSYFGELKLGDMLNGIATSKVFEANIRAGAELRK